MGVRMFYKIIFEVRAVGGSSSGVFAYESTEGTHHNVRLENFPYIQYPQDNS
jgi:hypothetical protein